MLICYYNNALIFFHLQEHDSARYLIQELNEDEFAKEFIDPETKKYVRMSSELFQKIQSGALRF